MLRIVSCCKSSNCVNLKVIDGGPGCSVEDSAHKQIVDASYSTCKHFTGSTSCGKFDRNYRALFVKKKKSNRLILYSLVCLFVCLFYIGWSDKISVVCKKTSYTVADTTDVIGYVDDKPKIPLGPCSYNQTYSAERNVPLCGFDLGLF